MDAFFSETNNILCVMEPLPMQWIMQRECAGRNGECGMDNKLLVELYWIMPASAYQMYGVL